LVIVGFITIQELLVRSIPGEEYFQIPKSPGAMKYIFPIASVTFFFTACSTTDDHVTDASEVPVVTAVRGCAPTLVHDRDWYEQGKTQPFFAGYDVLDHPITISEGLSSDRRDSVQRYFEQGLVMAYGFNHAEAARSFWQATRLDPECAMAWWGFAYVLGPNYNAGMEPDNYERAYSAVKKAKELSAECTPKEKALIDAMASRYSAEPVEDRSALDKAYSDALRTVAAAYPDDADVATLFAESLMDMHPWDLWEKNGDPKAWTPEIISTLERGMKRFPDHPGAHHLYIHAVEASRTPERALPSARFLGNAVPASGHLVHMPSHIFIRTGHYHDGVLANSRSVTVDSNYTAASHAQGVYPLAYFPHNIHFLSACATMGGERDLAWRSALRLRDQLARDLLHEANWSTLQHYHAYPYMVAVKLGLWNELGEEARPDTIWKYADALWHYAQGMRAVHSGDQRKAQEMLSKLSALKSDPRVQEMTIWGINKVSNVLAVAEFVLKGELMAAQGNVAAGIAELEKAVAAEDALQYQEPPDWSFPSRHELGMQLLRAGRSAEAEKVFRDDLINWPENGYALEGLRDALIAQGKTKEATQLADRIATAWKYADGRAG
jgi:tetratricopeptide (TPR) repeat protein